MIHADSLRLTPEDAAEQMYARMRRDMREAGLAAERRLRALERFVREVEAMHVRMDAYDNDALIDFCDKCQRPWPCDTAAALDRLREATS